MSAGRPLHMASRGGSDDSRVGNDPAPGASGAGSATRAVGPVGYGSAGPTQEPHPTGPPLVHVSAHEWHHTTHDRPSHSQGFQRQPDPPLMPPEPHGPLRLVHQLTSRLSRFPLLAAEQERRRGAEPSRCGGRYRARLGGFRGYGYSPPFATVGRSRRPNSASQHVRWGARGGPERSDTRKARRGGRRDPRERAERHPDRKRRCVTRRCQTHDRQVGVRLCRHPPWYHE